jgi:DNA repair exonuclease SbcCD ATPase subunit
MNDFPIPVVRRGYDPQVVDRRLEELRAEAQAAREQAAALETRVRELEERLEQQSNAETAPSTPTFEHLGERVGQILALAQAEAEEIRGRAEKEAADRLAESDERARKIRQDADRYAEEKRADADASAARIAEDAKRTADDRLDSAERDALARRQEAEAVYEAQRAKAAQAAADFETTLAKRREDAEAEYAQRMAEAQQRLEEAEQHAQRVATEAEAAKAEADRQARQTLQDAHSEATTIVTEARNTSARIRANFERELAAATHRRDSINAQLANVRQMLTTLTGGAVRPADVAVVADDSAAAAGDDPADVPALAVLDGELAAAETDAHEVTGADQDVDVPDDARGAGDDVPEARDEDTADGDDDREPTPEFTPYVPPRVD